MMLCEIVRMFIDQLSFKCIIFETKLSKNCNPQKRITEMTLNQKMLLKLCSSLFYRTKMFCFLK